MRQTSQYPPSTDLKSIMIRPAESYQNINRDTNDSTKTYLYNFDPIEPHFYTVKLGFTGCTLCFFLFLLTLYVLCRNMKNIRIFI